MSWSCSRLEWSDEDITLLTFLHMFATCIIHYKICCIIRLGISFGFFQAYQCSAAAVPNISLRVLRLWTLSRFM